MVRSAVLLLFSGVALCGQQGQTSPERAKPKVFVPPTSYRSWDFRQTTWGMTKEQVIASEGKPDVTTGDALLYLDRRIGDVTAAIRFSFTNGILFSAAYLLSETYSEPNLYVSMFNRWGDDLAGKYGYAATQTEWLNRLFADEPLRLGTAISAGHVRIYRQWETDTTRIIEQITGNNFEIKVGVFYESKAIRAPSKNDF